MKSFNLLVKLVLLVFVFGIVSCNDLQDAGLTSTGPSELTISGTLELEDKHGYPVGGVDVTLEQGGVDRASTTTNADGKYSFSVVPGDYDLKIDGVGYVSKTVPISVISDDTIPTQYVRVDHNTYGTIFGKVTGGDQYEAPLPEVKVSADNGNYVSYTSDAGFFSITVPHGAVSLEYSKYGYETVSLDYELRLEEPFVKGDAVLPTDISTYGVVYGVASMEFGDGTAAAPIKTYPYAGSKVKYRQISNLIDTITIVEDDGSFRIALPYGYRYDIRGVSIYHYNYRGDEFMLDSNNDFVDESYTLQLKTDKYGGVYGQVFDQFDRPLEGVNVTFINGVSHLGSVVSDDLGNFYAILDHSVYVVKFTKDGFDNSIEAVDLDDAAFAYFPSVTLNYASSNLYTLSGVITDSYGVAIEGASVEVYSGTTLLKEDVTDDSGVYSFSLPDGTYSLGVTTVMHESITGHQVVIDDADLTADFTLKGNGANLSAYYTHVLNIDDTGDLWSWGDNEYGQLGDNSTTYTYQPQNVSKLHPDLDKFRMVSAGWHHSLGLDVNGKLYAWGNNDYGQLGDGTTTERHMPVEVDLSSLPLGEKIVKVSAGFNASALITDTGTLLVWGRNNLHQLGLFNTADVLKPKIAPLWNVQDIVIASHATVALTREGAVYTWGSNYFGNLGIGNTITDIQTHHPQPVPINLKAVEISAGFWHFLALTDQGELYGWGYNGYGQLDGGKADQYAPKHLMSNVKTMSAGVYASYAILNNGTVISWGDNTHSALGDLSSFSDVVKLEGGHYGGLAMTSDDRIYGWGHSYLSGGVDTSTPKEMVLSP